MARVEALKVVVPTLKLGKMLYKKGKVLTGKELTQDLRSEFASNSKSLEEVFTPPETRVIVDEPEVVDVTEPEVVDIKPPSKKYDEELIDIKSKNDVVVENKGAKASTKTKEEKL